MCLPNEPFILFSFVNSKLRDDFSSLDLFCDYYNVSTDFINNKLNSIGFYYNYNENQFK